MAGFFRAGRRTPEYPIAAAAVNHLAGTRFPKHTPGIVSEPRRTAIRLAALTNAKRFTRLQKDHGRANRHANLSNDSFASRASRAGSAPANVRNTAHASGVPIR